MNDADRVARGRVRRQAAQETLIARDFEIQAKQSLDAQRAEIQRLVPEVLAALKRENYPNLKLLTVQESRRVVFFGRRTVEKGAWRIGSYTFRMRGDDMTDDLHLLSDGRFLFGTYGEPRSILDNLSVAHIGNILNGLQNLKSSLDA